MNSEKVKEIKELLRCMNGEKGCTNCYINEVAQEQETCCINVVADMTLELINELESENAKLLEENEILNSCWEIATKRIAKLEKENLKLNREHFLKVANFAKLLYTKYKIAGESIVYIFCTEEELNEEVQRCNYDS